MSNPIAGETTFMSSSNTEIFGQVLVTAASIPTSNKRKRTDEDTDESIQWQAAKANETGQSTPLSASIPSLLRFPILSDIYDMIFEAELERPSDGSAPPVLLALGASKDPATQDLYQRIRAQYRPINVTVNKDSVDNLNRKTHRELLKLRHLRIQLPITTKQLRGKKLTWLNKLITLTIDITKDQFLDASPSGIVSLLVGDQSLLMEKVTLIAPPSIRRHLDKEKRTMDATLQITGIETALQDGNVQIVWENGRLLRNRSWT